MKKRLRSPEEPAAGKLTMGPLWDFDLAAGNANYNDAFLTAGWHVQDGPWFPRCSSRSRPTP